MNLELSRIAKPEYARIYIAIEILKPQQKGTFSVNNNIHFGSVT